MLIVTSFPSSNVIYSASLRSASCSISLSVKISEVSIRVSELAAVLPSAMLFSTVSVLSCLVSCPEVVPLSSVAASFVASKSPPTVSVTVSDIVDAPHPPITRAVLKNKIAKNLLLFFISVISLSIFTVLQPLP